MRVHGGLYCLRIITRKYEFRSDDEGAPLAAILAATFPPLLATLQGLLASPSASTDAAVCLKLARADGGRGALFFSRRPSSRRPALPLRRPAPARRAYDKPLYNPLSPPLNPHQTRPNPKPCPKPQKPS